MIRGRQCQLQRLRKLELAAWVRKLIHPKSLVVTDGLGCFGRMAAASGERQPKVTDGLAASLKREDFR